MSELLQSFKNESLELLEKAEKCTLNLEREPSEENVNDLFRAIHTIKGNSGLFELKKVKELSHIFENVLSRLRNKEIIIDHNLVDIFLMSIDKLKVMIQNLENSESENISELTRSLNQYLEIEKKFSSEHQSEKQDNSFEYHYNEFLKGKKDLVDIWRKEQISCKYLILKIDNELLSEFYKNLKYSKINFFILMFYFPILPKKNLYRTL